MKSVFIRVYPWLLLAAPLLAADPISDALQKGLFEEEANHNFDAAIKAYQSVIDQTAEQRKLAATAVFRLGECYRKLNKTNDAIGQYQRIVREFSDQTNLFNLSQQNLVSLGAGTQRSGPVTVQSGASQPSEDAETKQIERLKRLAKDSPDLLNAKDGRGETPLHDAARAGQTKVAEFLLANKADVNLPTSQQHNTPLHYAVYFDRKNMVELLLTNGADVNAVGGFGENSADKLAPYSCQALHMAVYRGNQAIAELLLDHKAEVNGTDYRGRTPLHFAVDQGFLGLSRLLLSKGANVNSADEHGRTPAAIAALAGYEHILRLLLDSGADVNAQDRGGFTLVHYTTLQRSPEALRAVLDRKPDLEIQSKSQNMTPLMGAIMNRNPRGVEALLQAGANPNGRNEKGSFPLWEAVGALNKDTIRLLLAHKADPNQANLEGMTALSQAISLSLNSNVSPPDRKSLLEIADLLRQHGAKENTARVPFIGIMRDNTMLNAHYLQQDANGWNQFTLFELILFLHNGVGPNEDRRSTSLPMAFPDFTKIRIHRFTGNDDEQAKLLLNLADALNSGDCSKNVKVEWGDIIDFPTLDHKVNEPWPGLPRNVAETLSTCLERQVTMTVKDETKQLRLRPAVSRYERGQFLPETPVGPNGVLRSLRLKNVLNDCGMLRASSDKTHVRVVRALPKTGEKREIVLNLEAPSTTEDLLLQDSDAIYVPDKGSSSAASAMPPTTRQIPRVPIRNP